MKISNSLQYQQAVQTLFDRQNGLNRVQQQIASGQRINRASDSPAEVNNLLRLNAASARQETFEKNINALASRLELEQGTVAQATPLLDRFRVLLIDGINDTKDTTVDRAAIAIEMDGLISQLRSLANTRDISGNYLFAGSRVTTAPYAVDASGRTVFVGDQYRNEVPVGEARRLQGNRPATDVFVKVVRPSEDGPGQPVPFFRVLEQIATAMRSASSDLSSRVTASVIQADGTPRLVLTSDQTDTGVLSLRIGGEAFQTSSTLTTVDGATVSQIDFGDRRFNLGDTIEMSIVPFVAARVVTIAEGDIDGDGRLTAQGLEKLAGAINATTGEDQLQRGLAELGQLEVGLISAQATIGAEQNAAERQRDILEDTRLYATIILSEVQDVNYDEAITRLRQELLALEAFRGSFSRTLQSSLFDFLG